MKQLCRNPGSEPYPQAQPPRKRPALWSQCCIEFRIVDNAAQVANPGTRQWGPGEQAANDPTASATTHRLGRPAPNHRERLRTVGIVATACALMASCAVLTEEQRADRDYERGNRLVIAQEQFARQASACRRSGGMMEINKSTIRAFTYHDYKFARCIRH